MKRSGLIKSFTVVLAIVFAVVCLTGCGGEKGKIKQRISEFEKSCNSLDTSAMLNCFDPSVSDALKLGLGLMSLFSDTPSEDILDKITQGLIENGEGNSGDFFRSVKIRTEKIDVSEEEATVKAKVKFKLGDQDFDKPATFFCIKKEGEWYIKKFVFD